MKKTKKEIGILLSIVICFFNITSNGLVYGQQDSYEKPYAVEVSQEEVQTEEEQQKTKEAEEVEETTETTETEDVVIEEEKRQNIIIFHVKSEKAYVNWIQKQIDEGNKEVKPILKDKRTLLPIRFLAENLGLTVTWNAEMQQVTLENEDQRILFTLNSKKMIVNEKEVLLDNIPELVGNRVYIPVRGLVEALEEEISWDSRGLIIISTPQYEIDQKEEKIKEIYDILQKEVEEEEKRLEEQRKLEEQKRLEEERKKREEEEKKKLEEEKKKKLEEEKKKKQLVKASPVMATVISNTSLYESSSSSSNKVGNLKKNNSVEIIRDKSYKWYKVKNHETGEIGWVPRSVLSIPPTPATNKNKMTKEQIEEYANNQGFVSDTSYYIWVDLDRQVTNVLKGKKGEWKLERSMDCTTGKNTSPTVRGTFKIGYRGPWLISASNPNVRAKNKVNFYDNYYFHSTLVDANGRALDNTLGKRASSGCIRISMDNSKWLYDTIPSGSTVFIY